MVLRPFAGVAIVALAYAVGASTPYAQTTFAQTIAQLSEPGGYFDTDNLISNESSYLQVIPELERRGIRGGAYIGVGPDQNFSYIAATRPSIALIVDIRRDNLLLHLLFKALFQLSRTRVEYLSLLFGRTVPADVDAWRTASIERLLKHVDESGRADAVALRARVDRAVRDCGVPLSREDLETVARFHGRFVAAGTALQFQSVGRPPQSNYPTYRDLLADTDASGRQSNFLASEEAFQFVRGLEGRGLVIPIVGDLSGPTALVAIGRYLASRNERVTAFYTSNVEFYLQRQGTMERFLANLKQVPHTPNAVVIRSIFNRFAAAGGRPGDDSVSQLQPIEELLGR